MFIFFVFFFFQAEDGIRDLTVTGVQTCALPISNEVSAQLIEHFRDKVFRTIIPRNVRLAEAPSYGKPALHYDRESRGALAYLALAGEMIRREEGDFEVAAASVDAVAQ